MELSTILEELRLQLDKTKEELSKLATEAHIIEEFKEAQQSVDYLQESVRQKESELQELMASLVRIKTPMVHMSHIVLCGVVGLRYQLAVTI